MHFIIVEAFIFIWNLKKKISLLRNDYSFLLLLTLLLLTLENKEHCDLSWLSSTDVIACIYYSFVICRENKMK